MTDVTFQPTQQVDIGPTTSIRSYEPKVGPRKSVSKFPITEVEYLGLQQAYDFMNAKLFDGELPDVLITLQRKANSRGYFHADRFNWRGSDGIQHQHELALNPDSFVDRTDEQIVSTLVHEQVHCWEVLHGTAPKRPYHNKIWAAKMITIGLMPSRTGAVGGKITGVKVSHYILPDGPFAKAFAELAASGWKLNLQSAPSLGKGGAASRSSKTKFTCTSCAQNCWGKPDLQVICGLCALPMRAGSGDP
jgi:hypothetical protein